MSGDKEEELSSLCFGAATATDGVDADAAAADAANDVAGADEEYARFLQTVTGDGVRVGLWVEGWVRGGVETGVGGGSG